MENQESGPKDDCVVTPKTVKIFTEFAVLLKKIHVRLIAEGYTVTEGKIYKPGEAVPPDTRKKAP
jgi:hypothetical protein